MTAPLTPLTLLLAMPALFAVAACATSAAAAPAPGAAEASAPVAVVAPVVQAEPARPDTPAAEPLDTTRWSPELSMRFRAVGGTALSPDGRTVAFTVREPVMEGEKSEWLTHIWVAPADGSAPAVQYTRGEESASSPAFSPDGEWLAFTSSRSDKSQVWRMRVRGGEAERVTDAPEGVGAFAWSPDGTRIAYTARDEDPEEVARAKRERRHVIVVDQDFRNAHLHVVPAEPVADGEREATRLTEGAFHVGAFDWTPDGTRIVFGHAPDPRINTTGIASDLSVVRADGAGEVRPLVTRGGDDGSPLVSPDGRLVVFSSHGGQPERVGLGDLWVVPLEGGEPRPLAHTPDRQASPVAWSRSGDVVYVVEAVGVDRHLVAVPVGRGEARVVTSGAGVLGAVAFDRATSRAAFAWEDSDTPPEIYVATLRRPADRTRVSAVNTDVPTPRMGRTELLRWRSEDGLEIEGLLTYPVDYREGRRYPLILSVHGGPAGVYSRGFTGAPGIYMIQTFAQEGYAVLRPNPRGSTGYGRDFRYANVRDWGFGDFQDLMAGVDHVIGRGVAHPDSLAIMGWSYGGYMTSWAVTATDRFKAASMGAGLPNLVSMVTTTDIPDYLVAHLGGREVWEDYEGYERHSAMYRIANVTTPTQVIHGAEDLRVPFTQGQEFYVALQRRGVTTEMIVLPRTPHGPREPKLLMAVTPRILAWFERWVRGKGEEADRVATDAAGDP
ncbi:MAG TPA: S9 family peptidase [Longimicrobiales bacterium]|nr:S9 family peptidase [Longimicrobiales bacterium]